MLPQSGKHLLKLAMIEKSSEGEAPLLLSTFHHLLVSASTLLEPVPWLPATMERTLKPRDKKNPLFCFAVNFAPAIRQVTDITFK